jgi:hypothetical protein
VNREPFYRSSRQPVSREDDKVRLRRQQGLSLEEKHPHPPSRAADEHDARPQKLAPRWVLVIGAGAGGYVVGASVSNPAIGITIAVTSALGMHSLIE